MGEKGGGWGGEGKGVKVRRWREGYRVRRGLGEGWRWGDKDVDGGLRTIPS